MSEKQIKVSVCVVTYNQEKYVAECLESLVSQEANFPFEIIIGDDASTDKTPSIIQSFHNKYPHLIKSVLRTQNVGAVQNMIDIYKQAKGQYICHMDGDDLALAGKLQIQADTLDQNQDCIICSHDVLIWNKILTKRTFRKKNSGIYTLIHLYEQLPFFAHSSKMFRNNLNKAFWDVFTKTSLDATIHVAQAKHGNIYHLQTAYGIYRENVGITTSLKSLNPIIPKEISLIFSEALITKKYNLNYLKQLYAKAFFEFAYQSALYKNKFDFQKYIRKSIRIKIYSFKQVICFMLSITPTIAFLLITMRKIIKGRFKYEVRKR